MTMYLLEVVKKDAETWEVFIDGGQTVQYPTLPLAKAAARRRIPTHCKRLEWSQKPSAPAEEWVARASW